MPPPPFINALTPDIRESARWSDSVRDWLHGFRGAQPCYSTTATLEEIRDAMLDALKAGPSTSSVHGLRLAFHIGRCTEIQPLWYLRSDLMQELCKRQGEQDARRKLEDISALFEGLLPPGLQPRSRPAVPGRRTMAR